MILNWIKLRTTTKTGHTRRGFLLYFICFIGKGFEFAFFFEPPPLPTLIQTKNEKTKTSSNINLFKFCIIYILMIFVFLLKHKIRIWQERNVVVFFFFKILQLIWEGEKEWSKKFSRLVFSSYRLICALFCASCKNNTCLLYLRIYGLIRD